MHHLFLAAIIAAAVSLATSSVSSQTTFRSGVDIVFVTATVTNGHGHSIGGLKPEDFRVLDDGIPQEIVSSSAHRVPVSLGEPDLSSPIVDDRSRRARPCD